MGQQWKKIDGKSRGGGRGHEFHKADYYNTIIHAPSVVLKFLCIICKMAPI